MENPIEYSIDIQNILFSYDKNLYHSTHKHQFFLQLPKFQTRAGEQWMLVGPSGCGKSTLLNIIAGELLVQEGQVRVCGQNITSLSLEERQAFRIQHIGFIFQDFPLVPYLSAVENVLFPYRINPHLSLDAHVVERAKQLLESVGLETKNSNRPAELSQGERQRVAIARALITEPSIILADEPTAGLDASRADVVMDILDAIVEKTQITLVVVTHDRHIQSRYTNVIEF